MEKENETEEISILANNPLDEDLISIPVSADIVPESKPIGRPTDYTQDLADRICNELSEGNSLRRVCLEEYMPSKTTVFKWFRLYPQFVDQYARAKEESADVDMETIEDLGDIAIEDAKNPKNAKSSNAIISAYKLKADNLKWAASKKKPKKYGDKTDITSGGEPIVTIIKYDKIPDNPTVQIPTA